MEYDFPHGKQATVYAHITEVIAEITCKKEARLTITVLEIIRLQCPHIKLFLCSNYNHLTTVSELFAVCLCVCLYGINLNSDNPHILC